MRNAQNRSHFRARGYVPDRPGGIAVESCYAQIAIVGVGVEALRRNRAIAYAPSLPADVLRTLMLRKASLWWSMGLPMIGALYPRAVYRADGSDIGSIVWPR